jgi:beta-lactamase regulating signal transducer with metallopeptidase domain
MEDLIRIALSNAVAAIAMAGIVAILSPVLARRPAVVHALWTLVLLKLVTPPLFEVPVDRIEVEKTADLPSFAAAEDADLEVLDWAWPNSSDVLTFDLAVDPPTVAESEPRPIDAATAWRLLGAAWLAGTLATAALAAFRILRFQRRLRDASPAGDVVEDEVAALSAAMGLRRPPLVGFIDARVAPMLWGLGTRPRLILPRMLWKELDARRRTLLLTHELAHLRRGDHRLRFLELAVTVLYWWLPVVWWVRKAIRDVEERCCDAWVVWMFPDDARAYAETLLDAVDFLNPGAEPAPLLASGFGKVRHLRRRLTMIMRGTTPRTLGWTGSLGAMALAGVLLPIAPTWAQKPPETESRLPVVIGEDNHADAVTETVTGAGDGKKDQGPDHPMIRLEFRGAPGQAQTGLKQVVEELRTRIKELESGNPRVEGAEVQIKALKSALEALERMAVRGPATIDVKGPSLAREVITIQSDPITAGPPRPDDPKFVEARKRVDELQKDLAEKQNGVADAARKLAEAHNDLARLRGKVFVMPLDVAAYELRDVRPVNPPIAEGRAVIRTQEVSRDRARIDALERKLDKVLQQLESLNKSDTAEKK